MVGLVQLDRSVEEPAWKFEPSAQSRPSWVTKADRYDAHHSDGWISAHREKLRYLRREKHWLRQEREILAKAAVWFAQPIGSIPSGSSSS